MVLKYKLKFLNLIKLFFSRFNFKITNLTKLYLAQNQKKLKKKLKNLNLLIFSVCKKNVPI